VLPERAGELAWPAGGLSGFFVGGVPAAGYLGQRVIVPRGGYDDRQPDTREAGPWTSGRRFAGRSWPYSPA
jgi:hypothetical protein